MDKHGTRLYNLEKLGIPHKVSQVVDEIVTDAVDWAMQAPLRARFRDMPTVDMKEILQQRMFEDDSYKANNEEARKKQRKRRDTPRSPPGSPPSQPPLLPPLAGASGAPGTSGALGSSHLLPPPPPPSTGTSGYTLQQGCEVSRAQELSPSDDLMHDDSTSDEQVHVSDDQDSRNDHTPADVDSRKDCYEPPAENSLLAKTSDMTTFLNWYCRQINKSKLTQADLEGRAYEVVKADWANPEGDQVRINVNRPLPLGGPPGHVTIQTEIFFNKDLEYLRFGNKGSMHVFSISKMKAARYLDFGLEPLVPKQMWIEDVCTFDISAKVDFQEYTIVEKDFKNLYPSDFEDLNLLLLQGYLDHLSGSDKWMLSTAIKLWTRNLVIRQRDKDFQLGIESYQTQLNLTKPGWDATGYEFKHDYTIIKSPRAVIFPVNNNE
ncbi:hypothetical protein Tco_0938725 [Tanacetum coccineum]|uniref:Uncharacterized protein n=1 Tax=Tanacetum coccineum TaxID=301880 RepID=A0ABQ5DIN3_9ASTR